MEIEILYSKRKTLCIQVKRDATVVIRAPFHTSRSVIDKFVSEHIDWIKNKIQLMETKAKDYESEREEIPLLKKYAWEVIPKLVQYYASVVGVEYQSVSINQARTRFGSCSSQKRLNFSCFVMKYPFEAIEYVVLHEIAHLIEMNHSKKFWAIVERYMPDYKERQKLLKG